MEKRKFTVVIEGNDLSEITAFEVCEALRRLGENHISCKEEEIKEGN